MITLNQIVAPFFVDVPDAIKMRVISVIDFTNDAAIGRCFVGPDCYGLVQARTLDRFVEKGFGVFRIPSGGEGEVDYLTVRIDCPP